MERDVKNSKSVHGADDVNIAWLKDFIWQITKQVYIHELTPYSSDIA
jgi:hypothetical protein